MNASILLWTATWMAGGPVESQPVCHAKPAQEKPALFSNIRNRLNQLFGKQPPASQCNQCQPVRYAYPSPGQPGVTMEPPQADGAIHTVSAREFVPSAYRPQHLGQPEPAGEQQQHVYQVKDQFQRKIGRADDCSWVTGQLFYVHADGGKWILRYAAIDEEDKYGGSVVLASAVNLKNFREGDLVSVTGHLLSEARASKYLGGPLYRVETIDMMDRAD